jgi:hypothetical protein
MGHGWVGGTPGGMSLSTTPNLSIKKLPAMTHSKYHSISIVTPSGCDKAGT